MSIFKKLLNLQKELVCLYPSTKKHKSSKGLSEGSEHNLRGKALSLRLNIFNKEKQLLSVIGKPAIQGNLLQPIKKLEDYQEF